MKYKPSGVFTLPDGTEATCVFVEMRRGEFDTWEKGRRPGAAITLVGNVIDKRQLWNCRAISDGR